MKAGILSPVSKSFPQNAHPSGLQRNVVGRDRRGSVNIEEREAFHLADNEASPRR